MYEQIIKDLINDNKTNEEHLRTDYDHGYNDGYHDALVDLMNKLGIQHDEAIRNH